jgi:hypothetical protein
MAKMKNKKEHAMVKVFLCGMAVVLSAGLSACGGSGDGGSDYIDLSPSQLTFAGAVGQDIPAKTVDVNIGISPFPRFVDYANNNPSLVTVDMDIEAIDEFELRIKPATGLAQGTYTGTVDALVCEDDDCDDVNDRATIEYTITIN